MSKSNCATYSLIDKFLSPFWLVLSLKHGQTAFKKLNPYFGANRLFFHLGASFLRFHQFKLKSIVISSFTGELPALHQELETARHAQADAEFSRELSGRIVATIATAIQGLPFERLQILAASVDKSLEIAGASVNE